MVLFTTPPITFIEIIASWFLHYLIFGKILIKAEDLNTPYAFKNQSKRGFNFQEVLAMNSKYSRMSDQCSLRIYGGQLAGKGTIPYQVALRRGIMRGRRWVVFCGGAIITPSHVVTAVHCFESVRLRQSRVIAGTLQSNVLLKGRTKRQRLESLKIIQRTETWRKIKSCYGHAKYNRKRVINDFAILQVEKAFVFSTTVQPIPILTQKMEEQVKVPDDTLCLVSGYGLVEQRQHSSTLRKVCVPTVPFETCRRMYPLASSDTQICAGSRGKDSCQGDSGSPMTCKGVLIGIVSFGGKCGEAPGVYTRLTGYTGSIKFKFAYCSSYTIYYNLKSILLLLAIPRMFYLIIVFISF